VAPILLIFLRIKLTRVYACHFFMIEHEQVLCTDLNNSEIRYAKKLCIFLTGGVLTLYVYATVLLLTGYTSNVNILLVQSTEQRSLPHNIWTNEPN